MFEAKQIQFINLLNRLIQIFVLNDIFKNDLIFLFTVLCSNILGEKVY